MFYIFCLQIVRDSAAVKKISENSHKFLSIDPWGVGMTAIGMAVVFISLLLLYLLFLNITKVLNLKLNQEKVKEDKPVSVVKQMKSPEEANAAIALALHLYFKEIHDEESLVVTINKVAKAYSPWSSKIYNLRQYPQLNRK